MHRNRWRPSPTCIGSLNSGRRRQRLVTREPAALARRKGRQKRVRDAEGICQPAARTSNAAVHLTPVRMRSSWPALYRQRCKPAVAGGRKARQHARCGAAKHPGYESPSPDSSAIAARKAPSMIGKFNRGLTAFGSCSSRPSSARLPPSDGHGRVLAILPSSSRGRAVGTLLLVTGEGLQFASVVLR